MSHSETLRKCFPGVKSYSTIIQFILMNKKFGTKSDGGNNMVQAGTKPDQSTQFMPRYYACLLAVSQIVCHLFNLKGVNDQSTEHQGLLKQMRADCHLM